MVAELIKSGHPAASVRVAALRRLDVAVAEVGALDRHGRAELGVAAVGADASHVREVVDACERLVSSRPELLVLSARQRLLGPEDD